MKQYISLSGVLLITVGVIFNQAINVTLQDISFKFIFESTGIIFIALGFWDIFSSGIKLGKKIDLKPKIKRNLKT